MIDGHTGLRVMGMVDLIELVMLDRNRKRPREDEVLMSGSEQSIQKKCRTRSRSLKTDNEDLAQTENPLKNFNKS
ncbi:hypothetical protein LIER_25086 [Lithospermum erythrorhizon]|uniref:Uncharacterized protein n=1 Tax=Lithospermum erythrorhizon TaxID=34254 RepID=A0AAV3R4P4_LITER